jgi:starch-binding outer membrane protein, SusD/RagB family
MKRKFKLYSLFLAGLLAIGLACNKNSLNVPPVNATEADYFKTEAEFDKAVLGVYARLTDLYNHNVGTHMQPLYFLPGDDVTRTGNDAFEHFATLNASNGNSSRFYQMNYQIIGRANLVLQKLNEEKGVYTNTALKNTHKGEVLFLRGWAFFNLWIYYGKAPIVTERITAIANLYPPESKGTELLDQSVLDLSEAASLLPASWPAAQRGRVTANSANGMLGKVLVFRATVNKAMADFTAAITAFNKLSSLSLVPNFADNFDANKENNAESLFEFQASTAGGDNIWLPNEFDGAIGTMSAYWGYFYEGNTRSNNNINYLATAKLMNAFNPADPRFALTISTASTSGKQLIKWSKNDLTGGNGNSSANNPRILRFADVLLLKAEAILQSNGSTAEAIGLINQVRTRVRNMVAGGTTPADYSIAETNKTTILTWIMNERFIELAAEGHRWPDLKRWHLAGYISLNNVFFDPINASAMSFSAPKNLVFPIPLSEIDRNKNITQNPEY